MLILIGLLFLVRLTKCGKFKKTNSEDDKVKIYFIKFILDLSNVNLLNILKVGIVNAVYSR